MLKHSARPAGAFLRRTSHVKIKAIEVSPPVGGSWPDLWNTGWTAAGILAQLQQVKALGGNCTKVLGGTATESGGHSYPAENVYRQRRQYFLQQCRSLGLSVIWILGNGGNTLVGNDGSQGSTLLPPLVALMATLEQDGRDVIVAVDICNEFNGAGTPSTWSAQNSGVNARCRSDMDAFTRSIRAVTSIPLGLSIYVITPSAMATNDYIDLQYDLSLDYHDIHLYYQDQTYNPSGLIPAAADMLNLEGRTKYLGRYLIGEMGCALTAGTSLQTRWFNGIGDIVRRNQCHGAVIFIMLDFENTYRYGVYATTDTSFSSPRTGLTVPFLAWPGSL